MTAEQLAEGRRLESAASGPWYIKETRSAGDRAAYLLSPAFTFGGCWPEADATLAIWLRNNATDLLAAAERERRAMEVIAYYADRKNWDSKIECSEGGPETCVVSTYGNVESIFNSTEHGWTKAEEFFREAGYLDQPRHTDAPPGGKGNHCGGGEDEVKR